MSSTTSRQHAFGVQVSFDVEDTVIILTSRLQKYGVFGGSRENAYDSTTDAMWIPTFLPMYLRTCPWREKLAAQWAFRPNPGQHLFGQRTRCYGLGRSMSKPARSLEGPPARAHAYILTTRSMKEVRAVVTRGVRQSLRKRVVLTLPGRPSSHFSLMPVQNCAFSGIMSCTVLHW